MPKITLRPALVNRAYLPYLDDETRYQIFFGGAASGKSVFLATRCALDALRGRNTLVVRQVGRTLSTSCWNEIIKAVGRLGLGRFFAVRKSEMTITARNNGAQILFTGLDDVEKIKSVTPARGPLTDIWIEEATEIAYADFKQLDKRLRGASRHKKRMTLSFNPVYKTHWLYAQFFGIFDERKNSARSGQVSILKTTYRDNRFLSPDDRAALENERDPYYRAVYTLGEWGVLGKAVFDNWRVEPCQGAPGLERMGLDFGFAGDPCGFVKLRYDAARRRVYALGEVCERGLTNRDLHARLAPLAGEGYVVCDSAEPKSIAELRRLGLRALAAKKGPDSVLHGIQWLRQQEIIVDPACEKLRQELTLYQWRRDRDGNALREPQDKNNHLIDAMRYALEADALGRTAATGDRAALGI